MFSPRHLIVAMNQARLMENTLEVWGKKGEMDPKTVTSYTNVKPNPSYTTSHQTQQNHATTPIRKLPKAEYDARKEKGLCFTCNEKYTYGHKCSRLFQLLLSEEKEEETREIVEEMEGVMEIADAELPADGEISLHALQGCRTRNSLKLTGWYNKKKISILVDSGSTHSYLNQASAQELHAQWNLLHSGSSL